MTQYNFHDVTVIRDATLHIPRQVSAWELAVLNEVFGEGNVVIRGEFVREFATPDLDVERSRLERLYGVEDQSKIPYVDVTYGRGPSGIKALGRAISQAEVKDEPKAKKA